ncbi:TPA: DUF1433 domain-containing protein [Staphylococcus aureus]|nr:DUF1433 domain-containing protein [Staphylococcus aureus]
MNKKTKSVILIIVLIITILMIFAYILHKHKKENYIAIQEKRIDLYFTHNLNKYNNMVVTDFHKNPMGGYFVEGYINDNKDYEFQASIDSGGDDQFHKDIGYDGDKIGKLFKEKDPKYKLSVDEIIEKEHLAKSEYEAEPPLFFFSGPIE